MENTAIYLDRSPKQQQTAAVFFGLQTIRVDNLLDRSYELQATPASAASDYCSRATV